MLYEKSHFLKSEKRIRNYRHTIMYIKMFNLRYSSVLEIQVFLSRNYHLSYIIHRNCLFFKLIQLPYCVFPYMNVFATFYYNNFHCRSLFVIASSCTSHRVVSRWSHWSNFCSLLGMHTEARDIPSMPNCDSREFDFFVLRRLYRSRNTLRTCECMCIFVSPSRSLSSCSWTKL